MSGWTEGLLEVQKFEFNILLSLTCGGIIILEMKQQDRTVPILYLIKHDSNIVFYDLSTIKQPTESVLLLSSIETRTDRAKCPKI